MLITIIIMIILILILACTSFIQNRKLKKKIDEFNNFKDDYDFCILLSKDELLKKIFQNEEDFNFVDYNKTLKYKNFKVNQKINIEDD